MIVEPAGGVDDLKSKPNKSEANPFADVLAGVGLMPGPRVSVVSEPTVDETALKQEAASTTNNSSSSSSSSSNSSGLASIKQEKGVRYSDTPPKSSAAQRKPENDVDAGYHEAPAPSEAPLPTASASVGGDRGRSAGQRRGKGPARSPTSSNDAEATPSNAFDPPVSGESYGAERVQPPAPAPVKLEELPPPPPPPPVPAENETVTHSVIVSSSLASLRMQESLAQAQSTLTAPAPAQRTVSPIIIASSAGGGCSSHSDEARSHFHHMAAFQPTDGDHHGGNPAPVVQVKKNRKGGRPPKASLPPVAPESPPSSPDSAGLGGADQPARKRRRAQKVAESALALDHLNAATLEGLANHLPSHDSAQDGGGSSSGSRENLPPLPTPSPVPRKTESAVLQQGTPKEIHQSLSSKLHPLLRN